MSSGELGDVKTAINKCWNVGSLSTAAQKVKVTLRVEMSQDGKPIKDTITMTKFAGGDEASAQQAFETAKRAVVRATKGCGAVGFNLDPAKYDTWNVMNLNFDASGISFQ